MRSTPVHACIPPLCSVVARCDAHKEGIVSASFLTHGFVHPQVGEYLPEYEGLDPAFQNDAYGNPFDNQYFNQTTGMVSTPVCVVKNTASCYNHYKVCPCVADMLDGCHCVDGSGQEWQGRGGAMSWRAMSWREITRVCGKRTRPNHSPNTVMSTSGAIRSFLACGWFQVTMIGTMPQLQ